MMNAKGVQMAHIILIVTHKGLSCLVVKWMDVEHVKKIFIVAFRIVCLVLKELPKKPQLAQHLLNGSTIVLAQVVQI
jgi:hypothetical protein